MPIRITKNEKTDFIVNMTAKQFQTICFVFVALSSLAAMLCCVPYYIKKGTEGVTNAAADAVANAAALKYLEPAVIALMAFGFFGFLFLLIAISKKYLSFKKDFMTFAFLGGYLLVCGISVITAYDRSVAVFGNVGRYQGFVTIVSYAGLFAAASQLRSKKKRKLLVGIIAAAAGIHAVVGFFQAIQPLSQILPSFFTENQEINGAISQHFVANGFMSSPYALAALLTMSAAISAAGVMYEDNKKAKLFFGVTGVLSLCGAFLTKNIGALVGVVSVFAVLLVIEIVRIKSGHGLFVKGILKNPLGRLAALALLAGVIFAVLYFTGNFSFEDSYIVVQDSYYRLFVSYPYFATSGVKVYPELFKSAFDVVKDNLLLGTGLDCIGIKAFSTDNGNLVAGSMDIAYNEYLTIGAGTGVISLGLYLGFVVCCIKKGIGGLKRFFNVKDNWVRAAAFAGCAGYLLQALFSASYMTSTPVFFILLGLCFASTEE